MSDKRGFTKVLIVETNESGDCLPLPQDEWAKADYIIADTGAVLKNRYGNDPPVVLRKLPNVQGSKYRSIDDQ